MCLIPKINNSNTDKSLETIHKTIMRYLRAHHKDPVNANKELNNALPFYEEYNKTIRNLWSSHTVKEYVCQKQSKASKKDLVQQFIQQIDIEFKDQNALESIIIQEDEKLEVNSAKSIEDRNY